MARMRITHVSEVATLGPVGLPEPHARWAGEPPAPRQRVYASQTPPSDPTPNRSVRATGRWQRLSQHVGRERRDMVSALLLSLLVHTLVFSLNFGGQGLGLPGLAFPWRDRRIEVPDIRIVLVPARVTPAEPAVKPLAAAVEAGRRASPDPARFACSTPAGARSRERARDQTGRTSQAQTKHGARCGPCESACTRRWAPRASCADPGVGGDRHEAVRLADAGRAC